MVQSIFLSAIPLNNDVKMDPSMLNTLKNYCSNALENAGGISLLYNAINTETNSSKRGLLADIYSICDEVASEAAIRIAMEATEDEEELDENNDLMIDEEDPEDEEFAEEDDVDDLEEDKELEEPKKKILPGRTLEEIAIDTQLTDEEYRKLAKRSDKIDSKEISEIINQKVVKALNDEKDTYEAIDKSNQKLKDALIENEDNEIDTEDEAKEAATRILDKNFKSYQNLEHRSVFSKLQLDAVEALMCSESATIDNKILEDITFNETLSIFTSREKTLSEAIESAINMKCMEPCCNTGAAVELGTIIATIILTFIETLNTLNLHKVRYDEAATIAEKKPAMDYTPNSILENVNRKAGEFIEQQKREIRLSRDKDANALEAVAYNLNCLKNSLNKAIENGVNIDNSLITGINDISQDVHKNIAKIEDAYIPITEAAIALNKRSNEANIVAANTVAKYISKKNPDHIMFRVATESTIGIECYRDNKYVYGTNLVLQPTTESLSIEKTIESLARSSDLSKITCYGEKPKFTIINNGKRSSI